MPEQLIGLSFIAAACLLAIRFKRWCDGVFSPATHPRKPESRA